MAHLMSKVLVSDKLADVGLKILQESGFQVDVKTGLSEDELVDIIPEYDALVIRSGTTVTEKIVQAATNLKVIGRAGIGVDNVDLKAASKHGVIVMNTPTGNAVTTAEHAIAMLFAVSRHIPQAASSLKGGSWDKKKFTGRQLSGATLGIVGVGNIGRIVANRALGLNMKVIGFDPFLTAEAAEKLGIEPVSLDELYERASFITIHTPLNDKTRGLINKQAFQKMKPGVILVNCARGGIVVEEDLNWAIQEGIVAGAALDVFEQEPPQEGNPLIQSDRVIGTPHLGAATEEAQLNVAIEVAEQVTAFLKDGSISNAVNVPSVSGETLKILGPYLSLGEKLGSIQGQLSDTVPLEVNIEYCGDIADVDVKPITVSILKGILAPMLSDVNVNYVNAPIIAEERGIKVVESKVTAHADFTSLLKVTLSRKGEELSVAGSIFGHSHPRLVQINDFYMEVIPEGSLLFIQNEDKPGVIGAVGTLLGQNGVNISRMQLGTSAKSDRAIALYSVDKKLDQDLLKQLIDLPNILSAKQLEL